MYSLQCFKDPYAFSSETADSNLAAVVPPTTPVIDITPFTDALSAEPSESFVPIDFSTDDWAEFFQSQHYRDWYEAELARGVRFSSLSPLGSC